jgi:N-acetylmuramoyl-L-alanine amidase
MTRNSDVNLSLADRADIARRNLASIFFLFTSTDSATRASTGPRFFIGTKAGTGSEQLAGDVLDNLVHVTRAQKRGVRRADLGVLAPGRQLPATSACLVEIAFLSNPAQAKDLEGQRLSPTDRDRSR